MSLIVADSISRSEQYDQTSAVDRHGGVNAGSEQVSPRQIKAALSVLAAIFSCPWGKAPFACGLWQAALLYLMREQFAFAKVEL
jgi:hypothetical protein